MTPLRFEHTTSSQPPHVDPRARWEFNRSPTSALRAHGAAALFWTNNLLSISSSKPQSTWRVQHQPYVITNTLYNWCSNTRPPKTKKTSLGFNYIRKPFHLVELHQNPLFKELHLDSITPKLGKPTPRDSTNRKQPSRKQPPNRNIQFRGQPSCLTTSATKPSTKTFGSNSTATPTLDLISITKGVNNPLFGVEDVWRTKCSHKLEPLMQTYMQCSGFNMFGTSSYMGCA